MFNEMRENHFNNNNLKLLYMANERDIILAEDDTDDLLFFEMAIKETGVPVALRHAKDGTVLFILLEEHIPELLFLDINMPCKDGVSCIREIRQSKEYDHLPVIMYTSNLFKKTIEDCYRNGANFYLAKPDTLSQLSEKLKKVFSLDWPEAMPFPAMDQFLI